MLSIIFNFVVWGIFLTSVSGEPIRRDYGIFQSQNYDSSQTSMEHGWFLRPPMNTPRVEDGDQRPPCPQQSSRRVEIPAIPSDEPWMTAGWNGAAPIPLSRREYVPDTNSYLQGYRRQQQNNNLEPNKSLYLQVTPAPQSNPVQATSPYFDTPPQALNDPYLQTVNLPLTNQEKPIFIENRRGSDLFLPLRRSDDSSVNQPARPSGYREYFGSPEFRRNFDNVPLLRRDYDFSDENVLPYTYLPQQSRRDEGETNPQYGAVGQRRAPQSRRFEGETNPQYGVHEPDNDKFPESRREGETNPQYGRDGDNTSESTPKSQTLSPETELHYDGDQDSETNENSPQLQRSEELQSPGNESEKNPQYGKDEAMMTLPQYGKVSSLRRFVGDTDSQGSNENTLQATIPSTSQVDCHLKQEIEYRTEPQQSTEIPTPMPVPNLKNEIQNLTKPQNLADLQVTPSRRFFIPGFLPPEHPLFNQTENVNYYPLAVTFPSQINETAPNPLNRRVLSSAVTNTDTTSIPTPSENLVLTEGLESSSSTEKSSTVKYYSNTEVTTAKTQAAEDRMSPREIEQQLTDPAKGAGIVSMKDHHFGIMDSKRVCYACSSISDPSCWKPEKKTTVKYCARGRDSCVTKTYNGLDSLVVIRDCSSACDDAVAVLGKKYASCAICASDMCNNLLVDSSGGNSLYQSGIISAILVSWLMKYYFQ